MSRNEGEQKESMGRKMKTMKNEGHGEPTTPKLPKISKEQHRAKVPSYDYKYV